MVYSLNMQSKGYTPLEKLASNLLQTCHKPKKVCASIDNVAVFDWHVNFFVGNVLVAGLQQVGYKLD